RPPHQGGVPPAEPPRLAAAGVSRRAQRLAAGHGPPLGPPARNRPGALLRGLLRCVPCGSAMTPSHAAKGGRRYRYYTCVAAQKRGWHTCPSKSVPAAEIEALVVEQVREVGRDPALLRGALEQARQQGEGPGAALGGRTGGAGRASFTCCPASCGPARTTARWSPAWPSCNSGWR